MLDIHDSDCRDFLVFLPTEFDDSLAKTGIGRPSGCVVAYQLRRSLPLQTLLCISCLVLFRATASAGVWMWSKDHCTGPGK